jgi:DNA-directed RNA polymerase specialized sigma24 family protein
VFLSRWKRDLPEEFLATRATWAFGTAVKNFNRRCRSPHTAPLDGIGSGEATAELIPDYRAELPGLEEAEERDRVRRKINAALATLPRKRRLEVELRYGVNGHREHKPCELERRFGGKRQASAIRIHRSLKHLAEVLTVA